MPKSDTSARLVLAYLGEKADKHGHNSYPLASSVAHDLDIHPESVPRVFKRLVSYGLIWQDGTGPQGQAKWSLEMSMKRSEGSFEEFCERYRMRRSQRQSKWRSNPDVDNQSSSTVDDGSSSTDGHVDEDPSSRRRLRVVSETTDRRHVDDGSSPQNRPLENRPNRPKNRPSDSALELELPDASPKQSKGYTEAFEQAWLAYGRRGAKAAAFTEWRKAVKRADAETITAAIPGYVASTPELKFRKHFERWLRDDGWESAVVPATRASGYEPYRNPIDPNDYYGDL